MTTAGASQVRAIFNLYETTTPAPGFDSFLDGVKHTFAFVEKEPSFVVGQFHKNLDDGGHFKYAHFANFKDGSFTGFSPNPSPEWLAAIKEGHGEWGHQVRHPGGYEEITTWSGQPWCPKTQAAENSIFLLAAFKDVPEDFEKEWKSMSGMNVVAESLPATVSLNEAGLFRKLGGKTPLNYILRVELLPGSPGADDGVSDVLGSLEGIRSTLSQSGSPLVDIGAYKIIVVTKPQQ
ncbi:uncharacterized protein [Diadema setosum]|uniref:uncharacterized protein n=1 Tax=Diadema setosum TaxID=31175 RepID=UPI003B3A2C34